MITAARTPTPTVIDAPTVDHADRNKDRDREDQWHYEPLYEPYYDGYTSFQKQNAYSQHYPFPQHYPPPQQMSPAQQNHTSSHTPPNPPTRYRTDGPAHGRFNATTGTYADPPNHTSKPNTPPMGIAPPTGHPKNWSNKEVCDFMQVDHFAFDHSFRQGDINGRMFIELTASDLEEMRVPKYAIKPLLKHIKEQCEGSG